PWCSCSGTTGSGFPPLRTGGPRGRRRREGCRPKRCSCRRRRGSWVGCTRLARAPCAPHIAQMSADVVVYTTLTCPYCVAAKRLLGNKQVAFTEIDVAGRPDLRSWLVSASGQGTVPQVFINGRSLGGFTDIDALDRDGELDPLLGQAPEPGA